MQDAWRAYLGMAMGLTETPRKKAQDAVRRLVGSGEATTAQLQALAEELVSTGVANREALTKLVRFEVDRALGAVGLATADEVAELTRRVHELEHQLREAKATPASALGGPARPGPGDQGAPAPSSAGPAAARPTATDTPTAAAASTPAAPGSAEPTGPAASAATPKVAKKAIAKKAVAKKAVATNETENESGEVTKAVAKRAVAKKAVARKPPATVSRTDTDTDGGQPAPPAKKAAPKRQSGGAG
ncbi:phasin family protein [Micromonospora sp. DT233]|uniref:phasin family protein n=1 Tax=Micromonospora sp. DT233 TaxID=3393432 RepID=UPI003CF68E55